MQFLYCSATFVTSYHCLKPILSRFRAVVESQVYKSQVESPADLSMCPHCIRFRLGRSATTPAVYESILSTSRKALSRLCAVPRWLFISIWPRLRLYSLIHPAVKFRNVSRESAVPVTNCTTRKSTPRKSILRFRRSTRLCETCP